MFHVPAHKNVAVPAGQVVNNPLADAAETALSLYEHSTTMTFDEACETSSKQFGVRPQDVRSRARYLSDNGGMERAERAFGC